MTKIMLAETQKKRRGHKFYPNLSKIPALYSTDGQGEDAVVWIHYFAASGDWYITEVDPGTGLAFGWADLGYGELGEIYLPELEAVNVHGGLVIVERDLDWTPKTLKEAVKK